jgi:hypothetical protein
MAYLCNFIYYSIYFISISKAGNGEEKIRDQNKIPFFQGLENPLDRVDATLARCCNKGKLDHGDPRGKSERKNVAMSGLTPTPQRKSMIT